MGVNYVIATWGGSRRLGHNYGNYLYSHIKLLKRTQHNLSQITVVWPENKTELWSYKKFLQEIDGSIIGKAKVKILKTQNRYQSYSQYIESFKVYPDFDYYIFTEDDYVAVLDNFDSVLIEGFDRKHKEKRCGYLCGAALPCPATNSPWAGVSWGITNREVLLDVDFNLDQLTPVVKGIFPYAKFQLLFSCIFLNGKYTLCDMLEKYKTTYIKHIDSDFFGNFDDSEIISPIQIQERELLYSKRFLEFHKDGLRIM